MTRTLQEIKEYCSWNNIPYTIQRDNIKEYSELPEYMEERILIDLKDCIGGTQEGLMEFLKEK